jgi:hypothetical protein
MAESPIAETIIEYQTRLDATMKVRHVGNCGDWFLESLPTVDTIFGEY